ncbi:hypothetical protein ACFSNA_02845 [Pedobacter mendelii]|uniref:hypothetical protein n=1 Tax=Pedobacter mendelii TaxID=1908240 RepID=UPI00360C74E1
MRAILIIFSLLILTFACKVAKEIEPNLKWIEAEVTSLERYDDDYVIGLNRLATSYFASNKNTKHTSIITKLKRSYSNHVKITIGILMKMMADNLYLRSSNTITAKI